MELGEAFDKEPHLWLCKCALMDHLPKKIKVALFSWNSFFLACVMSNMTCFYDIRITMACVFIHPIPHTVTQNLTEFGPSGSQFPLDFSNLTEFSDHLSRHFYEEINIYHTLLCLSQASDYFGGASK